MVGTQQPPAELHRSLRRRARISYAETDREDVMVLSSDEEEAAEHVMVVSDDEDGDFYFEPPAAARNKSNSRKRRISANDNKESITIEESVENESESEKQKKRPIRSSKSTTRPANGIELTEQLDALESSRPFTIEQLESADTALPQFARNLRHSSTTDASSTNRLHSQLAGTLRDLELINFMSHEHFKFDQGLNPHINVITGDNGSGKSAILVALQVVFGARASETQRAGNLAELIRHNCSSQKASVTVWIANEGGNAFEPKKFGPTIVLRRDITTKSSTYTVESHDGRVREPVKSDWVEALRKYFNIQITNPCVLLTQEHSKKLVKDKTPHDLYEFFLRATTLDMLKQLQDQTLQALKGHRVGLDSLRDEFLRAKKRCETLKSLVDYVGNVDEAEQKLNEAYVEIKLAEFIQKNNLFVQRMSAYNQNMEELKAGEESLQSCDEQRRKLTLEREEAVRNADEAVKRYEEAVAITAEKKRTYVLANEELMRASKKIDIFTGKLVAVNKERGRVEGKLAEAESANFRDRSDIESKLHKAILAVTSQRTEFEQGMEGLQQQVSHVESSLRDLNASAGSLSEQKRNIEAEIEQISTSIQRMAPNSGRAQSHHAPRNSSRFGNRAADIAHAIDRSQFQRPPIGPLGDHIKVTDPSHAKWLFAIQCNLGLPLLQSYIVTSPHDSNLLINIFKSLGLSPRETPSVHIFNYTPKQIFPIDAPHSFGTHVRVVDCLNVTDPWLYNFLVDESHVEATLLMEDRNEAFSFLRSLQQSVYINAVYLLEGEKLSRRGTSVQREKAFPSPCLLAVDTEKEMQRLQEINQHKLQLLRQAEAPLAANNAEKQSLLASLRGLRDKMKGLGIAIHKTKDKEQDLQRKLRDEVSVIDTTPFHQDLARLASELSSYQLEVDQLKQQNSGLEMQVQEKRQLWEAAKARESEYSNEQQSFFEVVEDLVAKETNFEADFQTKATGLKIFAEKLGKMKEKLDAFGEEVAQAKQESAILSKGQRPPKEQFLRLKSANLDALREKHKRIESKFRSAMADSQKMLQEEGLQHDEKGLNELMNRFLAAQTQAEEQNKRINEVKNICNRLENALYARQEKWYRFRDEISQVVSTHFTRYLAMNRQHGVLKFSHPDPDDLSQATSANNISRSRTERNTQGQLHFSVNTDVTANHNSETRESGTLSGGERSYITTSLIMALNDAIHCPFRAMDEFDVFTDAPNRKKAIDLILKAASYHPERQFFLFTPLNVRQMVKESSISKLCSVMRLNPPVRQGQPQLDLPR